MPGLMHFSSNIIVKISENITQSLTYKLEQLIFFILNAEKTQNGFGSVSYIFSSIYCMCKNKVLLCA